MLSTSSLTRPARPMARHVRLAGAALLALGLTAGLAQAAPVVVFTATDIDGAAGNQWTYDFTVSGTANADESVNLLFDSALYAGLMTSNTTPGLMVLAAQPDPGLPADGMVTATFLSALGPPEGFTVEFTWLGSSAPGSQPYEYLDANFTVLATGSTRRAGTSTVPEPQMLPALLALAGLATWARRRQTAARG